MDCGGGITRSKVSLNRHDYLAVCGPQIFYTDISDCPSFERDFGWKVQNFRPIISQTQTQQHNLKQTGRIKKKEKVFCVKAKIKLENTT